MARCIGASYDARRRTRPMHAMLTTCDTHERDGADPADPLVALSRIRVEAVAGLEPIDAGQIFGRELDLARSQILL